MDASPRRVPDFPPSNSAAAADGNRCFIIVGATISRAVAAAERQTLDAMGTASAIAREAWTLAEAGSLEDAIATYKRALEIADASLDDMWHIHGEFGAVLARAQRFEDAVEQHRAAAEAAVGQGEGHDSTAVQVERYFAASLLLHLGRPSEALAEIADILSSPTIEPFVSGVEAQALYSLGAHAEARRAAHQAISSVTSEEQRDRFREQLVRILGGS